MFKKLGWRGAAFASLLAFASIPAGAQTSEIESFYAGSTVTILIGYPPGGSYDLYAQLAAQHLGKHIPGKPNVIVQHMPGGGGSLAAAFFANKAPRDGSMVALIPESLAHTQVLEPESSRWDLATMPYIGSFADVTSVMMVRKDSPAQTLEDMKTIPANVSCSGKTTSSAQSGAVIKQFADLKLNMVCGYDSATASVLAVFRGEADMTSTVWTTWTVNYKAEIDSGAVKPVIQFGVKRLADLPDVPTAIEIVDDPAEKQAIEFFAAGGEIGRALMVPPELEAAKYEALKVSFEALVKDPEFLADAEKRGIPIAPKTADEVNANVDRILKAPPEVVTLLKDAMEAGFK